MSVHPAFQMKSALQIASKEASGNFLEAHIA